MPLTDIEYSYTPEDGLKLFDSLLREKGFRFSDIQDNSEIKVLTHQQ